MELRKPVIGLDVDGVINAGGSPQRLGPGWQLHRVEIPAEYIVPSPFTAAVPGRGMALTVNVNPSLHGPWITRMQQRADVVWASTWEHAANYALPALLGIDPLPVGISVLAQLPRFGWVRDRSSTGWKRDALAQAFPDRPVVWIDDHIGGWPVSKTQVKKGRPPYLELGADSETGLTEELMNRAEEFVLTCANYRPSPAVLERKSEQQRRLRQSLQRHRS